jgi:hypothetical protein
LPELVTHDLGAYESLALELAQNAAKLSALRAKLARNRDSCALFDTGRLRRHIESLTSTSMSGIRTASRRRVSLCRRRKYTQGQKEPRNLSGRGREECVRHPIAHILILGRFPGQHLDCRLIVFANTACTHVGVVLTRSGHNSAMRDPAAPGVTSCGKCQCTPKNKRHAEPLAAQTPNVTGLLLQPNVRLRPSVVSRSRHWFGHQ